MFIFAQEIITQDLCAGRFRVFDNFCSGSSQFNKFQWETYEKEIKSFRPTCIIVVDLRQENHLFLNDESVSFYTKHWQTNFGLNAYHVIKKEENHKKMLQTCQEIRVFHRPKKDIKVRLAHIFVKPLVQTECEYLKSKCVTYKRYAITDYHVPDEKTLEEFVSWFKKLSKNVWLHFHCSAGRGRTTNFMIICDMLRTQSRLPFDAYMTRQVDIGGADIRKTDKQGDEFRTDLRKQRLAFFKKFYQAVKDGKYDDC